MAFVLVFAFKAALKITMNDVAGFLGFGVIIVSEQYVLIHLKQALPVLYA